MASQTFLVYLFISMIVISSIKSIPLTADDDLIENESFTIHPINFISLLCQQQEQQQQYPIKLIRKICSNYLQTNKLQEQQRGKRVGWTISV